MLAITPREVLEQWVAGCEFDVLVGGHTHVQLLRRLDERVIVNVGSVGMPFARALLPGGGEPKILPWCEYAVVSCTKGVASFDLRRVPLDINAFVGERTRIEISERRRLGPPLGRVVHNDGVVRCTGDVDIFVEMLSRAVSQHGGTRSPC